MAKTCLIAEHDPWDIQLLKLYTAQLGFGNQISASLGYDHEKIRNAIQNKFMHDLWFWPSKWNKLNEKE